MLSKLLCVSQRHVHEFASSKDYPACFAKDWRDAQKQHWSNPWGNQDILSPRIDSVSHSGSLLNYCKAIGRAIRGHRGYWYRHFIVDSMSRFNVSYPAEKKYIICVIFKHLYASPASDSSSLHDALLVNLSHVQKLPMSLFPVSSRNWRWTWYYTHRIGPWTLFLTSNFAEPQCPGSLWIANPFYLLPVGSMAI